MTTEVLKSDCILCVHACGINATVENGRLVKVEGMPEHPLNEGYLCPRGQQLVEYIYSPDRLTYPQKRTANGWERISWDQALTEIGDKLQQLKAEFGAHSLAIFCGSIGVENNELAAFARRFRGAYGTPNFLSVESNCYRSRILAHQLTFGTFLQEEPGEAKCVILWGHDPDNSKPPLGHALHKRLDNEKDFKLIVINPKKTALAKRPEAMYVPIRPGTDGALVLALLNVIISEGLYARELVEKNTVGFDKLAEHIKEFTPEKVSEITGVPVDKIWEIARTVATTKPACSVVQGICALDQHINGLQTNRAIAILQAITGNIDVPGSWANVPFPRLGSMHIKVEEDPLGAKEHPLFYGLWGRQAPYGQTMYLPEAVLEGKPYPVKSLIVTGGNPALTLPDSATWVEMMKKLDLLVVIDQFMTDTAKLAHYVLPACSFVERMGVGYVYAVTSGIPYLLLRKKLIEPVGECWPDWKFWSELARKMGMGDVFPWKTDEEVVDHWLAPTGFTRQQLTNDYPQGAYFAQKKYDMVQRSDWRTPSKKIEIYSQTLADFGYDPLPKHVEPSQSPRSNPKLFKEYPVILITGTRMAEYTHAQFRNVPSLRKQAPEPEAELNPSTAKKYGISNGDMMVIATRKGQIKLKAKTTEDMMEGTVSVPHGWADANVNLLTELMPRDPVTGYTELKGLLCKISRAEG